MLNKELQEILSKYPPDAIVLVDGIVFTRCGYEGQYIEIDKDDVDFVPKTNEILIQGARG